MALGFSELNTVLVLSEEEEEILVRAFPCSIRDFTHSLSLPGLLTSSLTWPSLFMTSIHIHDATVQQQRFPTHRAQLERLAIALVEGRRRGKKE